MVRRSGSGFCALGLNLRGGGGRVSSRSGVGVAGGGSRRFLGALGFVVAGGGSRRFLGALGFVAAFVILTLTLTEEFLCK